MFFHQETSWMISVPSLLKPPSLDHRKFGDILGNAFSLDSSWHLLPLLHSVAWEHRSLFHLVGGPGSRQPQGKEIMAAISNIPLPRKEQWKEKPELFALCSGTEWRQKISSKQDTWVYPFPSLPLLYLCQLHSSAMWQSYPVVISH